MQLRCHVGHARCLTPGGAETSLQSSRSVRRATDDLAFARTMQLDLVSMMDAHQRVEAVLGCRCVLCAMQP